MEAKEREIDEDSIKLDDDQLQVAALPPAKPKDPRSKAKYNIFSRIFFFLFSLIAFQARDSPKTFYSWIDPLYFLGFRRDLNPSDLFVHPSEADSEELYKKFTRVWNHELNRRRNGQKARLWITIPKIYWWRFFLLGILHFIIVSLQVVQALFLGALIRYFSIPCNLRGGEETRNAYLFGAAIVVNPFISSLLNAHAFLIAQKIGMMCRIMMTSAIYNKVLSLSQVTIGKLSIGHIINLASNDVQRFDQAFIFIHYIWIGPVHYMVITYLIYLEIGWSVFVLLTTIILQLPVTFTLSKLFAQARLKSAKITDKRVRVMNEIITGIRVIKMYAWEYAFKRVVTAVRKHETKLIRYGGLLRSLTSAIIFGANLPLLMGVTFLTFTGSGHELTTKRVFTTLALVNTVRRSSAFMIRSFFFLYESTVALKRLQTLFLKEELKPSLRESSQYNYDGGQISKVSQVSSDGYFRPESPWLPGTRKVEFNTEPVRLTSFSNQSANDPKAPVIRINNLTASWSNDAEKTVLKGISFDLDSTAPLMGIVGPVGSGKSTLLQCLLRELDSLEGSIEMNGRISYASQDPWIFTGTLRENILFGFPYQKDWYNKVISACALDKDVAILSDGDLTLVGERGVTLSGGQKARVNLARAVYHDADVYLLDDPLSAVDTAVGKHLFEECLRGILKDKLVILVTHQVHFALQADKLLALKDGSIHIYGSQSELLERNIDTTQLLGLIKEKKEDEEYVYKDTDENSDDDDYTFQSKTKALRHRKNTHTDDETQESVYTSMTSLDSLENTTKNSALPFEEKAHGSISMMTYVRYFRAGGNYFVIFLVVLALIIGEVIIVISDWWLSDWASCAELRNSTQGQMMNNISSCFEDSSLSVPQTCSLSTQNRQIIYASLIVTTILLNLLKGAVFYLICINASRVLHNRMFRTILRIPVRFFDTNPSGRILNRFSKDVGFLDDLLPPTFLEYLFLLIRFLAILFVAAFALPYILIPLPFIGVLFLLLRWYFLKTSRDVKRLEAIARSPIYSHISTTLQGLPTIRTFGRQDIAVQHLHKFNNEHTQGWYIYLVSSRWFGMRIDFISNMILLCLTFFTIPLISETDTSLNPALLGLAFTYTITLTGMFQFCVRQSTEVENIMISTERIMDYGRLESEASLETSPPNQKPPEDWPSKGEICLEDVSFRYASDLPLVLNNLSFSVRPSEKIGIVGRTGAGKSSLLSVLYRLAKPSGSITIDGVDTKSIGLHDLRKKMSIIPQDPVLFSGTMRYNLDPFEEYSDAELWKVLEQVQLKPEVEGLEGQLSGEVSEGGSNFSVGQRQLVCLARALLRKNKILILDEATANVDPKTDSIIQEAIRVMFVDCTVLTIAHRLNTIMDSDRILVINNGQVKEFASPYRLLQNPLSQFYKMVEKTGPEASQKLHQMALNAHSRVNKQSYV